MRTVWTVLGWLVMISLCVFWSINIYDIVMEHAGDSVVGKITYSGGLFFMVIFIMLIGTLIERARR